VVNETRLVDPAAPGAGPSAYATTATAACQMLGYSSFGSGTMHTTGEAMRRAARVCEGVQAGSYASAATDCEHLWSQTCGGKSGSRSLSVHSLWMGVLLLLQVLPRSCATMARCAVTAMQSQ
jgi:hypothetical protein